MADVPQVQIEPVNFSLDGFNALGEEEVFIFLIQSGISLRRYILTPKHAKRISLLLEKTVDAYEKAHGVLETQLPSIQEEPSGRVTGFDPNQVKPSPENPSVS